MGMTTLKQKNVQMWLDEAQRRYKDYKNGRVVSRDAFEAIADMRERLSIQGEINVQDSP